MKIRTLSLFLAVAVSAASLVGCSGQSTAEACQVTSETVKDVAAQFNASNTGLSEGKYGATADALQALADSLDEATAKVSNTDVKTELVKFRDGLSRLSSAYGEVPDGDSAQLSAKLSDLSQESAELAQTLSRLSELCPSA